MKNMKKQNGLKHAPGGIPEDVAGVPEVIESHDAGTIAEDVAGVPEKPSEKLRVPKR